MSKKVTHDNGSCGAEAVHLKFRATRGEKQLTDQHEYFAFLKTQGFQAPSDIDVLCTVLLAAGEVERLRREDAAVRSRPRS